VTLLVSALVSGITGSWFVILFAVAYDIILRQPMFVAPPYYAGPTTAPPASAPSTPAPPLAPPGPPPGP
jgi:hypothetical protein